MHIRSVHLVLPYGVISLQSFRPAFALHLLHLLLSIMAKGLVINGGIARQKWRRSFKKGK